jgi:serine/threonine-protein kinase
VTALNLALQFYMLVRLGRVTPRPQNLYLIVLAWPATAMLGVPDVIAWLGLGDPFLGLRTASLGMMMICLLQATALSREHLLSLRRADRLNADLAVRVREVEHLNEDLRRHIAARSRELAESFAEDGAEQLAEPVDALDPGDVVQRRYRVVRRIGEGGMGFVYEVERIADNSHFALKVLSVTSDGATRARFAREAQVAATVDHPNVVSIVDFEQASEGYLFLVMELVEGNTLLEVRRRNRDIPWTLFVLAQVAAGLGALHRQGIVHRDLKPGNVLLSRGADGRRPLVKITDFGISSLVDERPSLRAPTTIPIISAAPAAPASLPLSSPEDSATLRNAAPLADSSHMATLVKLDGSPVEDAKPSNAALTQTGIVFGTPSYMAAELVFGVKNATRSSDVFSLGVIAFELLTGHRPFHESPLQTRMAGRNLSAAPRLLEACPSLDPSIAEMLERALGHDPATRPSAQELAEALRTASERLEAHAERA